MSAQPTRVVIVGANGRMGRRLQTDALASPHLDLHAAVTVAGDPDLGAVVVDGGPALTTDLDGACTGAQVVIDFSAPDSAVAAARAAANAGAALLSGTTGLSAEQRDAVLAIADRVPVLQAANTSLGVNLLSELVELAARTLGTGWDAEIVELHHNKKKDSPSGTALALAEALARGRGQILDEVLTTSRSGHAPHHAGEIGAFGVRGGDVAGEHTVYLFGEQERLELVHRATDRGIFVRGALHAAAWLAGREPGRYTMRDVLFA